jgi:hypothetical protein
MLNNIKNFPLRPHVRRDPESQAKPAACLRLHETGRKTSNKYSTVGCRSRPIGSASHKVPWHNVRAVLQFVTTPKIMNVAAVLIKRK